MTKKFTVKQHKPSGKWAIYQREGNKTNKADDKLIRIIEHNQQARIDRAILLPLDDND